MAVDENEIIYESKVPQWKIVGSWVGVVVLLLFTPWLTYWSWQAGAKKAPFFLASFGLWRISLLMHYLVAPKPKVLVFPGYIKIKSEKITFDKIGKIQIGIRRLIRGGFPAQELVRIFLKDGKVYNIDVLNYNNGSLLREICEKIQHNISAGCFEITNFSPTEVTLNSVRFEDIENEQFQKYHGQLFLNIFICLNTIFFLAFILWVPLRDASFAMNLLLASCVLLFLLYNLSGFNYLLYSPNYLVVRHYLYFWQITIFKMADVLRFNLLRKDSLFRSAIILTRDYEVYEFNINKPSWDDETQDKIIELIKTKQATKQSIV